MRSWAWTVSVRSNKRWRSRANLDEPALLARTLTTYGFIAGESYDAGAARACFAEAIGLSARSSPSRR
jgi:hypothetical protein